MSESKMEDPTNNPRNLQVKSTTPIKLKDKAGRGGIRIRLREVFGFLPEEVIIQKVAGSSNTFILSALLTHEELEKEKALLPKPMGDRIKPQDQEKGDSGAIAEKK